MAVNEIELQTEIDKIKSSRFSVKGYFSDLFGQILPEELLKNERISVVNQLINEDTLPDALNKEYPKDGYVLFFYAHKSYTNLISPYNGDKNASHTSVLLCKVTDNKINQVLNIDGYNNLDYMDILGERSGATPNQYIKNRLVIDVQDDKHSTERRPLQSASWENVNCPLYAFAFVKAILNIFEFAPPVIDNLFLLDKSAPSHESLGNLKDEILQGVTGIYVKQVNRTEFYRDRDAAMAFHNGIRSRLAETVTARYHVGSTKSPEVVSIIPESDENIEVLESLKAVKGFENVKAVETFKPIKTRLTNISQEKAKESEDLVAVIDEKQLAKTLQQSPSLAPISIFNKLQPRSRLPSSIGKLTFLCTDYQTHLYSDIRKLTNRDPEVVILEYKSKSRNETTHTKMDILINKCTIVNQMLHALQDSTEPNEFTRIHKMKEVLTPQAKEILSAHRSVGGQFLQAVLNVLSALFLQNWKYRAIGEALSDKINETPELATPAFK